MGRVPVLSTVGAGALSGALSGAAAGASTLPGEDRHARAPFGGPDLPCCEIVTA